MTLSCHDPVTVAPVSVGTVTVVVVDDAPEVRSVVLRQLALNDRFSVVGEGATGAEAVRLAAAHQPDLLLLDVSMPDVDGLAALPAVLAASPATSVVLFSGFGGTALGHAARHLGALGVLDKSLPTSQLPGRLLQLLEPLDGAGDGAGDRAGGGIGGGADDQHDRAEALAALSADGLGGDVQSAAALARNEDDEPVGHLEGFRTIFDNGAIGMAGLSLPGTFLRVNPALQAILGRHAEELVGTRYAALAGSEERQALDEAIASVARGEQGSVQVEHALASRRGQRVCSTISLVRDRGGRPLYLFAQTEDDTARHTAMEELRASEERFRLLVESVQDYAIFMLDRHGRVTTWNLGAEAMKGYRADEIIGQHFRIFYPPVAQEASHPEHVLETAVREGRYEEEGWRVRKDGRRFWASVVITAVFDRAGQLAGFAKVTRDVTERRLATQASEAASAELARANRQLRTSAEQTSQFLAMTAHELQSPVAAMTGAAGLLADSWDQLSETERDECLQNVCRGGTRLRRLLEDLLTAARLEAGSFDLAREPVAVAPAITEAVTQLPIPAPKVVVGCPERLLADADPVRVIQIVTNLLSNAAKYGKDPIRVRASRHGPAVEVRVCDSGPGVPEELAGRLFQKFATGRVDAVAGTGLGLFIVRELARAQGGDAWYERTSRGEPCFAFTLPAIVAGRRRSLG